MATHSSILAWRIPGTGEPGGLLSVGSHRDRHSLSDLAAAATSYYITYPPIYPFFYPSVNLLYFSDTFTVSYRHSYIWPLTLQHAFH